MLIAHYVCRTAVCGASHAVTAAEIRHDLLAGDTLDLAAADVFQPAVNLDCPHLFVAWVKASSGPFRLIPLGKLHLLLGGQLFKGLLKFGDTHGRNGAIFVPLGNCADGVSYVLDVWLAANPVYRRFTAMRTVQEIQDAIIQLTPQDRKILRHWLDAALTLTAFPPTGFSSETQAGTA